MCAQERGLGRGLDSLFRNAEEAATGKESAKLPIASLEAGMGQPRVRFDDGALAELADSIRSQGIIQPILVRPIAGSVPQRYEIVAGERRWRAAKKAGLSEVPVLIRTLSDDDVLAVALIENIQREDLNAVEEAQAIEKLRQTLGVSQDELAKRLGKSRSAIANSLRLLQLPEILLHSLSDGRISAGHARCLLAITDEAVQRDLHAAMLDKDLSVRDAEAAVAHWKRTQQLPESLTPAVQENRETHSARKPGKAQPRSKAPLIRALQQHLRKQVHPKTTLSGTMEMGRITLPYESAEQLGKLLTQLGISLDELDGRENAHD